MSTYMDNVRKLKCYHAHMKKRYEQETRTSKKLKFTISAIVTQSICVYTGAEAQKITNECINSTLITYKQVDS